MDWYPQKQTEFIEVPAGWKCSGVAVILTDFSKSREIMTGSSYDSVTKSFNIKAILQISK